MDFATSKETLSLYKLIILYMLNKVNFPLTLSQISEFIVNNEIMNYLTLNQVISELMDNNLICSKSSQHKSLFTITPEGRESLGFFEGRIGDGVKQDIIQYLKNNSLELRNEVSVLSNYYKNTHGEFEAVLIAKEKDVTMLEIKLCVPTSEIAEAVCTNWTKKNQEIYDILTQKLF